MNQYETTQNAFMVIERLAALCATPGIDEATQKIANEQIQSVLNSVIKDAVTKMNAKGAGILL